MKALQTRGAKFRAETEIVIIRHVAIGILPWIKTTSLRLGTNLATRAIFDMLRQMRSPAKSQRKVVQRISCFIEKVWTIGLCVSQDPHPRKSKQRNEVKLGSNHTVKLSRSTWHQIKKSGKERVHREEFFKSVNLMNVVLARPGLRRSHKRKPRTKKAAPTE